MLPDLLEIKALRKQLGFSQAELARLAGVSQSLVAKVESGKLVPSYENAKRLLDCLEKTHEKSGTTAKDLMSGKVFFVREQDSVKRAIKIMEERAVSQLPVLSDGKIVGTVSEKELLGRLNEGHGKLDLAELKVSDIMDDAMPTIQESTPLKVVSSLLSHNNAAIVSRKGRAVGIVTKADLLKAMLK